MSAYRHPCGAEEQGAALTILLDQRWAQGRCRACGSPAPWRAVADGPELKELGQQRATSGALSWTVQARRWLLDRAIGERYTSEDLTAALGQPPSSGAVGSVMTWGGRRRLHVKVDRTQAERPNQHAAELTVWQRT